MPGAPNLPVIPEYITVHLGKPNQNAPNVQVPFVDYVKSVASSEIYPTWPENSIRANVYAIVSFALNRIYTEWYRSKGYNFDITNSTQFDQAYQHQRDVFDSIGRVVDELFNDYVIKDGGKEPYFTSFCNGTTSKCKGLSQWGTVDLAKQGKSPYDILKYYYGNDIGLVKNAPVTQSKQSYPGTPLRLGMSSNEVKLLQIQLNRIRRNFPSITKISMPDGVFGPETEKSVKSFQKTFNLTQDGIVGKATWYKVKEIYNGVKQLGELTSEGVALEDITPPYLTGSISLGDHGVEVQTIQYYISVIGYFNDAVPVLQLDGLFGPATQNAVRQFQQQYGLPVDGIVGPATWSRLQQIYTQLVASLPADFYGQRAPLYPGYVLKKGMESDDVRQLQTFLTALRGIYPTIPAVKVTGLFGDQTYAAVLAFQKIFGLTQSGTVGPLTWGRLASEYDAALGLT